MNKDKLIENLTEACKLGRQRLGLKEYENWEAKDQQAFAAMTNAIISAEEHQREIDENA